MGELICKSTDIKGPMIITKSCLPQHDKCNCDEMTMDDVSYIENLLKKKDDPSKSLAIKCNLHNTI